jgi:hypothetical protein
VGPARLEENLKRVGFSKLALPESVESVHRSSGISVAIIMPHMSTVHKKRQFPIDWGFISQHYIPKMGNGGINVHRR